MSVQMLSHLTSLSFCRWVNESLLPNSILEPGYPRRISVQTARVWLHELGFEVIDQKKGVYIDGHERDDVVQHRQKFLRHLVASGFLTKEHAPSDEAKDAFPNDLESPPMERRSKNIFIFHDESTFTMKVCSGVQQKVKLSGQKVVDLASWFPTSLLKEMVTFV